MRRVAERFRAVSRPAALLFASLPAVPERLEFEQRQAELERALNGLVVLDGAAREDALSAAEVGVADLETRLLALDALVPMTWFREHVDVNQTSSVALADYIALLARPGLKSTESARLDRVQYLASRLVLAFVPVERDSPALRRHLLAEALPATEIGAEQLERAKTFLHDAGRRLATFGSLNALFSSGLLVDVRGYKLSLGTQILAPELMAGVLELNEAIDTTIERLAAAERTTEHELAAQLAEVDARIKAVFERDRTDEAERSARLTAWLRRAQEAKDQGKPPPRLEDFAPPRPTTPRRRTWPLALVAGVLALLVAWRSTRASLTTLSPEACRAASDVVVSCVVAPDAPPQAFVGQVDRARWALMEQHARRQAAVDFAQHVREAGWASGTVLLENTVVMQVQNGTVTVVQ